VENVWIYNLRVITMDYLFLLFDTSEFAAPTFIQKKHLRALIVRRLNNWNFLYIRNHDKMRFSIFSVYLSILAPIAVAAPTPTDESIAQRAAIVKRATITDIADTGYATQNGG
jgi:hypothetical protein